MCLAGTVVHVASWPLTQEVASLNPLPVMTFIDLVTDFGELNENI